jgi:hypothetical protein
MKKCTKLNVFKKEVIDHFLFNEIYCVIKNSRNIAASHFVRGVCLETSRPT